MVPLVMRPDGGSHVWMGWACERTGTPTLAEVIFLWQNIIAGNYTVKTSTGSEFDIKALQRFIDWLSNNSVFKHASGFHGKSIIVEGLCCENFAGKKATQGSMGNFAYFVTIKNKMI